MSVHLTNAVSILEENNKSDSIKGSVSVPYKRQKKDLNKNKNVSCSLNSWITAVGIKTVTLTGSKVSYLLESLQMKGKHWWGRRDQHLLQGISVDILLGS